jgi:microcystin-dependent protein
MATLTIPNSFSAGTAAVASQVNANFTAVKSFVEAISSGVNIDSGAVTAAKLDSGLTNTFVPLGGLVPYAGASAPAGGKWMLADGAAISRSSYAALFALVGTTYGAGDGTTTFNLPNLKGRVVVGLDATQTEFDALGETGGAKSVTLTAAQSGLVAHSHSITDVQHSHSVSGEEVPNELNINGDAQNVLESAFASFLTSENTGLAYTGITGTQSVSSANASQGHENLQPYAVLNYLVRVA